MRGTSVVGLVALLGCGEVPPPPPADTPVDLGARMTVTTVRLRAERAVLARGVGQLDMDVLLPTEVTAPVARATLQHLIDSAAAADTMLAAVRVTGFVLGRPVEGTQEATVDPAITGTWVPSDTLGITGSRRRAVFRTHFILHKPLPERAARDGS